MTRRVTRRSPICPCWSFGGSETEPTDSGRPPNGPGRFKKRENGLFSSAPVRSHGFRVGDEIRTRRRDLRVRAGALDRDSDRIGDDIVRPERVSVVDPEQLELHRGGIDYADPFGADNVVTDAIAVAVERARANSEVSTPGPDLVADAEPVATDGSGRN